MSEEQHEGHLTPDSYARFLRAGGRPDLGFFLGLDDADQEAMAEIGDAYSEDLAIAQAYAIHDPDAAAAGMGVEEAEERVLARLGAAMLARAGSEGSPGPSLGLEGSRTHDQGVQEHRPTGGKRDPLAGIRSPTMGGRGKRQAERTRQDLNEQGAAMSLGGKKPDPVEVAE